MGLFTRAIRPPEIPNGNDPASVPPGSVGPTSQVNPGDPHGVVLSGDSPPSTPLPTIVPSPWSGWPADWNASWYGQTRVLTDTAWMCIDLNASLLSTMPPYLVEAAPSLDSDWLVNPNPDVYASWQEFAKQVFWDYQAVGEVFIVADSFYSTGWPARFHVVQPHYVTVTLGQDGLRHYAIGSRDVTDAMLHIRYTSTVGADVHGHGPLEAGNARIIAAQVLSDYATKLIAGGGIPASVLEHPDELSADQSSLLQAQWVQARLSSIGEPAVLSGGVTWKPTSMNPKDMALIELSRWNETRIAYLLGVPGELVGLPVEGDPMTYRNVAALFDYHWRAGLRPKAEAVMQALSYWALPRGTTVELNRDAYTQPPPLERAQTAQILNGIVDQFGNPAMTVDEIRASERLSNTSPDLASGVLK
jgi:HK97 family phage portal protein